MSCPHAETTTLLWLYGEGDDDHALHVAGCADCQAVAELHTDVISAVAPALPVLAPPVAERPDRRVVWGAATLFALAAAALLMVRPALDVPAEAPGAELVAEIRAGFLPTDDVDLRLQGLTDDLLELSLDFESL